MFPFRNDPSCFGVLVQGVELPIKQCEGVLGATTQFRQVRRLNGLAALFDPNHWFGHFVERSLPIEDDNGAPQLRNPRKDLFEQIFH